MDFLPCSFPHNDFLLLGGEARHSITNLAGLKRCVTDDATIFHNVEGDPTRTVSGVILHDRSLALGEHRPERGEVLTGRYCGIRPADDEAMGLELVADEMGTIPVYYAETAKGPMASNSIRLIALAMKAAGVPVRLSLGSIASTWFTTAYFTSTQVARETYVEQVFIALLGQRIFFRKGEMQVTPAEAPKGEPPRIEEYRYLLDKGIEEIRENIIAIVNSGLPVGSTLTGGRDSRLVLGALLSLGREKDVLFSTNDVNEDDTRISTALARYFGLAYQRRPDHVTMIGRSFEDDLEQFTLANMGAKTAYKRATGTAISDEVSIMFIGGSGELYRTGFTKGIKQEVLNSKVNENSVRKWLRSYPMFGKMTDGIRDVIVDQWLGVFKKFGAATIGQAIDLHYANLRNRLHLGAPTQYRRDEKTVLFSPATSPTLFHLIQRMQRPAVESDRLIHDMTRAFNFDLAHLPYDRPLFLRNPETARRLREYQDRLVGHFHPDPDMLKMPAPKSREFRGHAEKRDFREFCQEAIRTDMNVLREHEVVRHMITDDFCKLIEETTRAGKLQQISTWLGKFRAARMVAELGS